MNPLPGARFVLHTVAVAALAACAPQPPQTRSEAGASPVEKNAAAVPPSGIAGTPRAAAPHDSGSDQAPVAARTTSPAAPSASLTANQYHTVFARHLMRANQESIFDGAPPNPLYALVVLEVELARDGQVANVRTLRVPSHAQALLRVARESISRAAPFPAPAGTVALGKSRITLTETWLFNAKGRFQLRSIALPQQDL